MKLGAIVLDSNNSGELSDFYKNLLGWNKRCDGEWIVVSSENGDGVPLVFQQIAEYEPPVWPAVSGLQQQMAHLDFYVRPDDFEKELNRAVSLGAKIFEKQFSSDWTVLMDPAGHPFCIIPIPPELPL